ncbi:hypothetical protein Tco_0771826 [Tanacetum coccineum]|uniref:Uncharacterized protein n=1 Tax=Tanacetum coccineum TaxID=301880 RepID=A0ABQ4ZGH0_9ASTR
MHTSRDDYLINTLRFISAKETTQIYGDILPESLTSPEMKETKAYKTYIGYATGATPPKKARKVKRPAKKSTKAPARGVVIRETPEMPLSKKKEKMTVEKRKGINLLSEVELTEEAQYKEARKKCLRDFHKTHPSGSEESSESEVESWGYDEDDSKNEQDSSGEEKSGQEENEEDIGDDEEEVKNEFVKTPSNDSDDEDEIKITDNAEGDEDEEIDYNTNIPHTDAEIVSPMDVHVHHEVPIQQTPTLLTVLVSVITGSSLVYPTVIPQSIPSFTPPPPQSTPTPPPTTEATNPQSALPDFAFVFQFNNRVSALEKDVSELRKDDPLKTQVTALVDEHLDARLGATREEFMNYLSVSITIRITKQVKNQLPQILQKGTKESSQPQSSYEAAATLTEFELKKIMIDKKDKRLKKRKTSKDAEPTKGPKAKESLSGSSKGTKSQPKSSGKSVQSEEPEFEVADSDMPQDQEENPSNDD